MHDKSANRFASSGFGRNEGCAAPYGARINSLLTHPSRLAYARLQGGLTHFAPPALDWIGLRDTLQDTALVKGLFVCRKEPRRTFRHRTPTRSKATAITRDG